MARFLKLTLIEVRTKAEKQTEKTDDHDCQDHHTRWVQVQAQEDDEDGDDKEYDNGESFKRRACAHV